MLRKISFICVLLMLLLFSSSLITAQEDDTSTATTSNVTIFVVICENQAVVNLSGTMQVGYDVYFQIFTNASATGTALSSFRQVAASGTYTFSEIVTYTEGQSIAFGNLGSAYISIAREGNSDSVMYETTVTDIQDGCADPVNPLGVSNTSGGTATTTTGVDTDSPGTNSSGTSAILSPFGGVVNPNYVPPPREGAVVIGARDEWIPPRQETPGLVFAECNDYPVTEPGLIYDTDNVIVFWSWFASTAEEVQDHIDNVDYGVTYYQLVELPNVVRTPIQQIGGNYWVFYYARLGNLEPGDYYIEYHVEWESAISDGYDTFGPDTDNVALTSGCWFQITPNLNGIDVDHNDWPYQD